MGSIDGIPVQLLPEDSPYYVSPQVLSQLGRIGFEDTDRDLGSVSAELRDDLVAFLTRRSVHYGFYSCPALGEYCSEDGRTECDCGADQAAQLLARLNGPA